MMVFMLYIFINLSITLDKETMNICQKSEPHRKEVIPWRYFALRRPATTR